MTIVRPSIVFGPNVDNYIVRGFENNPFVPILDGVDEEFQLVHEDDVVSALLALLDGKITAPSTWPATGCSPGAGPPSWSAKRPARSRCAT